MSHRSFSHNKLLFRSSIGVIGTNRFHADLVLFDPERIDAGTATLVHDLPGDSPRLDAKAIGVRAVWVNGVEAIRDDAVSGAVPGKVLRSGRDTRTVSTR